MLIELSIPEIALLIMSVSKGLESGNFAENERADIRSVLKRLGALKEMSDGPTNDPPRIVGIRGSGSLRSVDDRPGEPDPSAGSDHGAGNSAAVCPNSGLPRGRYGCV